MEVPNTFSEWFQTILTAGGGATIAGLWVRRKLSRDNSEIVADHAATRIIATLQTERDIAMKAAEQAWETRTTDATSIARLEAEAHANERELSRVRDELFVMRLQMRKLMAILATLAPEAAKALEIVMADQPRDPAQG